MAGRTLARERMPQFRRCERLFAIEPPLVRRSSASRCSAKTERGPRVGRTLDVEHLSPLKVNLSKSDASPGGLVKCAGVLPFPTPSGGGGQARPGGAKRAARGYCNRRRRARGLNRGSDAFACRHRHDPDRPRAVYPPDFRCEKLDASQVRLLRKTGLADAVLAAGALDRRDLDRPRRPPGGEAAAIANTASSTTASSTPIRAQIPKVAAIRAGEEPAAVATSADRRDDPRSPMGKRSSARLVVMANGLDTCAPPKPRHDARGDQPCAFRRHRLRRCSRSVGRASISAR